LNDEGKQNFRIHYSRFIIRYSKEKKDKSDTGRGDGASLVMVRIAVIADDLTGAADTGVQFCPYFADTILLSYGNLLHNAVETLDLAPQALAIHTDSRSLKGDSARERLGQVAHRLLSLSPKHVYKKVDSCLRGNLGAEVEAIMDEMAFDLSLIAPAFPDMGRTTLHDLHLIDGTPVAETELSRDPVTPVAESCLSLVVAGQSRYQVGHVDVGFLDGAGEALVGEIDRLVRGGARHLVFDATNRTHLDRIVGLALGFPEKTLLVGSAGLAESLGRYFPRKGFREKNGRVISSKGNHLMVCGTASERTKLQISTLTERFPYEVITLGPGLLADPAGREALLSKAHFAQSILSENNTIVRIGTPQIREKENNNKPGYRTADQIVEGLGFFTTSLFQRTRPAGLFLTGGDTANAVLKGIRAKGMRLVEEVIPGMAQGMLVGGLMDGLPVVTKAGAFGKSDALVALHEYWKNKSD
jgi:uncharacterized protein YgbK (DUF1537 family)